MNRFLAYTLAGLHLISEFELSGVTPCKDDPVESDAIRIRQARVPCSLNSKLAEFPEGQWDGERLLILIPGVARYLVSRDQIDVEALKGSSVDDVRAFLLGTVFGALCHLRGIFPLHASTIEIGGRCIAFTGDSGAGKSTIAAVLTGRGHRLVSDDVTFIAIRKPSGPQVWCGTNRLRLWESAMEGLGYSKQGIEREFRGFDKFLLPAKSPSDARTPHLLRAIYRLEAGPPDAPVEIEHLRGAAAIEVLLQNTYRLHIAEHIGRKGQVFAACADVAREVPVFRFRRPMSFALLDLVSSKLEEHLATELASS